MVCEVDLKFTFYSKIFFISVMGAQQGTRWHICAHKQLFKVHVRCTIMYTSMLLGAQKMCTKISNS